MLYIDSLQHNADIHPQALLQKSFRGEHDQFLDSHGTQQTLGRNSRVLLPVGDHEYGELSRRDVIVASRKLIVPAKVVVKIVCWNETGCTNLLRLDLYLPHTHTRSLHGCKVSSCF